ncbi:hypothetical protein [Bacteroides ovatus]|uniref:hypothetical protein n=1 Tax=Bacteroides ovatus TaxID=28116 RepID=UPI00189F90B9|nr:hypothetical protein [Bacteroides ovatus]
MKRNNRKNTHKVDLNSCDKKEVENMISSYEKEKNIELPLQINNKLVIMVSPENCNERYRQKYIKRHLQYEK